MVVQNWTLLLAAAVSLIITATTLFLQLIIFASNYGTNEALLLFKAESENRFIAIEIQNKNQDEEIEFLKRKNLEIHNQMSQMDEKLNGITTSNSDEHESSPKNTIGGNTVVSSSITNLNSNLKRPARLLPLQLIS